MHRIFSLLIFYKRLLLPLLLFSALVGSFGFVASDSFSFKGAGLTYIVLSPFLHYIIYEIRKPHEYYFHHNLGFSQRSLWAYSSLIGLSLGLSLFLV